MSYEGVVGLLNPAMSAIFCISLLALWRQQRHLTYVAIFALSYAIRILCFGLLYFAFAQKEPVLRQLSNALVLLATMTSSAALSSRRGQRPRYGVLSAIGVTSLAGLYVYQFVQPSLQARAAIINLGLAAVCVLMLLDVAKRPRRTPVEHLLFGLVAIACTGFLVRPLVFQLPGIAVDQIEGAYWLIVSISDALICSTLAVAIFAIIAVDVMDGIRSEAQTDVLSGLLNRRGFEIRARDALARQTAGARATMILSDLDHFKSINDRFGHTCGDRVIRAFSEILKDKAPREAIIARLGGEEFAVLLPPGQGATAHHLAETVRASFKTAAADIVSGEFSPTASFGIAAAREHEGLLALIDRADRALYQAKREGRDRVRQAG
ncbi:GGDEF domain-containing protein [Phreatobacter sp. AB_2022a]|uniref:GGDEF domain-containing protein n=1 Tax=Phreatobacter sp. AB_2022a TaxID=3003134 RepID=UPI002286E3E3|nr:GGDEF domain-containing protein [Phreatobacter sp. AB_2022a]MCZ0737965.1 GGDEF domain-containing protein [Phreatobacter sp. AB_2022a]